MTPDLAIIGGGPAAAHIIVELNRRDAALPRRIFILDRSTSGWAGSAHSDANSAFRVNMRTELHDIAAQISFKAFLAESPGSPLDPPLRYDLGRYTCEAAEKTCKALGIKGCSVERILESAVSVDAVAGGYHISLDRGKMLTVGAVILATGNEAPTPPSNIGSRAPVSSYSGSSHFAAQIRREDEVLCVGTGPGAIDVCRYLIETIKVTQPVHLRSQTGLLSTVQTIDPIPVRFRDEARERVAALVLRAPFTFRDAQNMIGAFLKDVDPNFSFRKIIATPADPLAKLREDIAAAKNNQPAWRMALEAAGEQMPILWRGLQEQGKAEFVRGDWLRRYYVNRHAMQLETAKWFESMLRSGRITVGSTKKSLPRHSRLVCANGPQFLVSKSQNPLIRHLLHTGQARPAIAGGVELGGVATDGFEVIGSPGMFAIGALARGEDFAVHSYPALARHAASIVQSICGQSGAPTSSSDVR